MSVLVIGATGFIGPRLIRRLVARGESVVGMDLNPGAATFGGVPIGAPVIRGDVTHFEDVMRTVLDVKPDRLINLAYGLGAGEGNPHQVLRLDVLGMDNCFEAARLAGVKRVVYASSIAVSGQQSHFGDWFVDEDDPVNGTSQYAMHKIFNEFQARKYIKNYGMSIVGVRPANVTGPDKVRGSVDHVQIMTDAARGKPVHLPNKGMMRLLVHVDDMAEIFMRILLAEAPRHHLYNSGGIPVSLGELADAVRRFLPDAQITFANEGGREESGNYLVDWSRLAKEFGIEYPGLHTWVLQIINDVRRQEGRAPVSALHLASRFGHRRAGRASGEHRRVQMLLVPELGAERIVLEHVHVVEALGRMVARVFHQRVVGPAHVAEAARARRLDAVRLRLGDLRSGQAGRGIRARPRIAAEEHLPALVGGVERQQREVRAALVRLEARARVGDVPAEVPERGLRRRRRRGRHTGEQDQHVVRALERRQPAPAGLRRGREVANVERDGRVGIDRVQVQMMKAWGLTHGREHTELQGPTRSPCDLAAILT